MTVLSPYLKLLVPLVSKIGLLFLMIWIIVGFLNSSLEFKQRKKSFGIIGKTQKRREKLQDYTDFLDSSLPLERLQKSILHVMDNIIVKGFSFLKLKDVELEPPTCHLKSINKVAVEISEKFIDAKEDHLEQRIWVGVWSEVLGFIRAFKKLRAETLKENLSSSQRKNLDKSRQEYTLSPDANHLDEYNSLDGMDWEVQENSWPSQDLDELLLQISSKFIKKGYIHPAIGSPEREKAYIRLLMDQVFFKLGWKEKLGNKLSKLFAREAIGCFGIWAWIDKWSQPEILNNFILDKAIKRYIAQASVKSFRGQLQTHFTQFPPRFLRKHNQKNVAVSLASKYRYFEGLSKYAKKSTCMIDLKAVYHQILLEIRSRLQEANELVNQKSDAFETLKRYLKALDSVRLKFEKRISMLIIEDEKIVLDKKKSLRIKYRPLLSLRSLLDEYLAIGDVIRSETSSSLFYFLEFLDQEGSLSLIRFWLSATKLRKIYSQWTAPTSLENSEKIQEEIQKIYKAYSTGTFYGLNDALKAIEIFSLTQLSENLREACLAIFKCQSVVFDDLQIYFNQFLDSDHYFRLATELQRGDGSNDNNSSSSNSTLLRTERLSSSQNSIILSQLEVSLERESLRLTGSKNYKDKETLDVSDPLLFNSIEEVLDVEALESNIFDENQNESQVFSGLDFQTSELLHSSTKLQQIKEDLDRNQQQMDILDTLLQKYHYADNNTPSPVQMMQIHILEQSQALVRQEMNDLSLDKVKYQTQEQKEAIVPGLCIVRISKATESTRDRKSVTFYEIIVDKDNGVRRWTVRRRYNDFLLLHRKLKEKYPIVHEFDLPGKNFSMFHSKIEKEELKMERMTALEKYLQRLIDNPLICQSEELRNFLSSVEYEKRQYNTVESIMENEDASPYKLKSGAHKFAQLVGNAKKKLHIGREEMSAFEKSFNTEKRPYITSDDESSEDQDGDWGLSNEEQTDEESASSLGVLSDPLCSVLVELFDFKEKEYYLKKNSSAMLMKQYFGGRMSLESEIAGMLSNYMTEDLLCRILSRVSFDRLLDPMKRQYSRSEENLKSSHENTARNEMKSKLFSVWPDSFARFLGADSTQTGVGRTLDLIQSSTLNRHIMFTILDSIMETLFEE